MHGCPRQSLNKVLWKREKEELNSAEGELVGELPFQQDLEGAVGCQ